MNFYRFGGHKVAISFVGELNRPALLPSFEPFALSEDEAGDDEPLFDVVIDDSVKPVDKALRQRIGDFDSGNGHTIVDQTADGGYQFIIKNTMDYACCLLIADHHFRHIRCALNGNYQMRSFGLNNALMLTYSYSSVWKDTLLIHASLVRQDGYGYAFVAKSGTGKSTQVAQWLKYLPGCDLMNDDNPIIRLIDGRAIIYGGPWSGKTPCYRNVSAPIGAITRIHRAPKNSIERMEGVSAFASLLPTVASMKWDKSLYERTCDILIRLVTAVPVFTLHCLPDREAAEICNRAIKIRP